MNDLNRWVYQAYTFVGEGHNLAHAARHASQQASEFLREFPPSKDHKGHSTATLTPVIRKSGGMWFYAITIQTSVWGTDLERAAAWAWGDK